MPRPPRLSPDEIRSRLTALPSWEVKDGKLHRAFTFPDFNRAFAFMTDVARAAEAMDHHPDWQNVYNRVIVDLNTHDAGGITALDFDLAARMSALAARHAG
jgi:4a-hydroxytetrahydrobiopterin dehydratase